MLKAVSSVRLNVFGKLVEVQFREGQWIVFYIGEEGKKRPAHDLVIPADISESELPKYLADLCHEWARPGYMQVEIIN